MLTVVQYRLHSSERIGGRVGLGSEEYILEYTLYKYIDNLLSTDNETIFLSPQVIRTTDE